MAAPEHSVELEELDARLVAILLERVAAVHDLGADRIHLKPSEQEARALRVRECLGEQPLDVGLVCNWLQHADSICARVSQPRVAIAYLGPIYSYSYLAAVKHFGLAAHLVPVATIEAAFREVIRKHASYAVVPIENSTDGRVVDTLGMFAKSPVQICGEVHLPIHHCLLGRCSRADIVEVQSKPQAISQCRKWLAEHLPAARVVEAASTAVAAANAASQQGVAAIASVEAGVHHGLEMIDANIEDNTQNLTRFAVIGKANTQPTGRDKTSLMFQLPHQPGALAKAMTAFERAAVNLTWIESFPLPGRPNEYLFFVELEGHEANQGVQQAISELGELAHRLDVLGSYPKGSEVQFT